MASANNLVRFKDQSYTVETPELGLVENSLAVEEAYGAQQIRGGQPGYWDDAEAG